MIIRQSICILYRTEPRKRVFSSKNVFLPKHHVQDINPEVSRPDFQHTFSFSSQGEQFDMFCDRFPGSDLMGFFGCGNPKWPCPHLFP